MEFLSPTHTYHKLPWFGCPQLANTTICIVVVVVPDSNVLQLVMVLVVPTQTPLGVILLRCHYKCFCMPILIVDRENNNPIVAPCPMQNHAAGSKPGLYFSYCTDLESGANQSAQYDLARGDNESSGRIP